ncbi:hypothetical protein K458DRAFT_388350 [Lentithecium fluviatile CBS 122367]|uniref:Uncharacterized protein n=1 Tax=Lentithecium fluviatile CBS 122367 TaxID=1168545 RepID=A0A6G1J4M8_9PLEO|nr:hypothetical protein K458DRAFT_388350 [Lentithecium fluviatile CBS 122367]
MYGIHCKVCHRLHIGFRYKNLHPTLRIIEELPFCCVQGYETKFLLYFNSHFASGEWPQERMGDLLRIMCFCTELKEALHTIERFGLGQDLFTHPISTRLIVYGSIFTEDIIYDVNNEPGIRVEEVVAPLSLAFRQMAIHILEMDPIKCEDMGAGRTWDDIKDAHGNEPKADAYTSQESFERHLAALTQNSEDMRLKIEELEAFMGDLWRDKQESKC